MPEKSTAKPRITSRPDAAPDLSRYIPRYAELKAQIGLNDAELNGPTVSIPAAVFKMLMADLVRRQDFDEMGYKAANPDVVEAVKSGKILSAHEHYVHHGYFEGRLPGQPTIDEAWYLRTNPDVNAAVRKGTVKSASAHYSATGHMEGRAPSAAGALAKGAWDTAMNKR